MKLAQQQYNDLKDVIEHHDFSVDAFSFVKKRGWVSISSNTRDQIFSFFKKKTHRINPQTQKLEQQLSFQLKFNNGSIVKDLNWNDVILSFDKWLTAD